MSVAEHDAVERVAYGVEIGGDVLRVLVRVVVGATEERRPEGAPRREREVLEVPHAHLHVGDDRRELGRDVAERVAHVVDHGLHRAGGVHEEVDVGLLDVRAEAQRAEHVIAHVRQHHEVVLGRDGARHVERVGLRGGLGEIGHAIAIGVDVRRARAEARLVRIGEAVVVAVEIEVVLRLVGVRVGRCAWVAGAALVDVEHAVSIGVRIEPVADAIAVGVVVGLDAIGDAVAIGVELPLAAHHHAAHVPRVRVATTTRAPRHRRERTDHRETEAQIRTAHGDLRVGEWQGRSDPPITSSEASELGPDKARRTRGSRGASGVTLRAHPSASAVAFMD